MAVRRRGSGFQHNYVTRIISAGDEAIPPARFYLHKTLQKCMQTPEEAAQFLRNLKNADVFRSFDGVPCFFITGFLWLNDVNGVWQKNLDLYTWNFGDKWNNDPAIVPWYVCETQKSQGGRDFWASDALNLASQYWILNKEEEHRNLHYIEGLEQFWEHPPQIHGVKKTIVENI